MINVHPSCTESNEKIAYNYSGVLLKPGRIEVSEEDYLQLSK
jgi:hypothetical protein